ncbi:MAG: RyR domain-containing protein [Oscillospiraceae bacterium]|nr:RyR domain-containing protein [Oscillospiraceae bacterium]
MNPKDYVPAPLDTSDVQLSPQIIRLGEMMARNTHEVWAAGRIADGWRWGPVRDDAKKEHPCLVPYDDLPEEERDYDRRTSMETLKLLVRLGCTITFE